MVSFRGQKKLGPRPDRPPLGVFVNSKLPTSKHPHPFHMRSPPPPPHPRARELLETASCTRTNDIIRKKLIKKNSKIPSHLDMMQFAVM